MTELKTYYQDGAYFYDAKTGKLIAVYEELVDDDFDVAGAIEAEENFLIDHPEYNLTKEVYRGNSSR